LGRRTVWETRARLGEKFRGSTTISLDKRGEKKKLGGGAGCIGNDQKAKGRELK